MDRCSQTVQHKHINTNNTVAQIVTLALLTRVSSDEAARTVEHNLRYEAY
jgi:hypothetical protein